jgi:CDP-glucose 4,6-dehydratase
LGVKLGAINIGPGKESFVAVEEVANIVSLKYGTEKSWDLEKSAQPRESELLALDASKALKLINWHNKLKFQEAIDWTIEWHKTLATGSNARDITISQIRKFITR